MKINVIAAALAALCALSACEQRKVEEPVLLQEDPFTFTAVAGADTRVSAEFGDTENVINFKWSADDSLFVCFVETDSLALYPYSMSAEGLRSPEFNSRWETFVFKLKSGAGTSRAVFQSVDMMPETVLKRGVNYVMSAVYHPADPLSCWSIWDSHVQTTRLFQQQQEYDPDDPLSNIAVNVMLGSYPVEVTTDSSPEIRFAHGSYLYRVRVRNTGADPLSVASIEVPGGSCQSNFYAPSDGEGYVPRYFGEKHYTLSMRSPIDILPGETRSFYLSMMPAGVPENDGTYDWTHIVNLSDGRSISVPKSPEIGFKFCAGRMYSTTLPVRVDMATSGGEIPPVTGGDEDDL